jgi:PAS domain S-box-containing protein
MAAGEEEEQRLRSAALQTSTAILRARDRAEQELVRAKEALEQKTRELAHSLAMARATLESTTDGVLVTDEHGRVTDFNEKFVELWRLPRDVMAAATHQSLQELIAGQLKDGTRYREVLKGIYESWPTETFDLLELTNGARVERYSKIQTIEARPVGRVWSYRDTSARKRAEEKLQQQREWLEVTLSSIGDAVITTDLDAKITYLNPVAEKMTGWKSGEAIGLTLESVFKIVSELTREPATNPVRRVLQEGRVIELANHTALISRDGTATPIEDSAAPIRDAAGNISGAVMVFHDVTQRRQAERRLRESEERLRAAFNQAAVGMATASLDGRFEQVNRRFSEILGYSAAELCELSFWDLTYSEDLGRTETEMRRLRAGEISDYALEKRYVRKDGGLVWSLTTVTLLRDEHGRPVRFIGVIEDISQRRAAEEALQARERELSLIYNNVSDVIFYLAAETNGDFRFVSVNRAFLTATALAETQVVGKRVSEVISEPSRSLVLAHYQEAIREKRTVRWEETSDYPSGRKAGAVSITPIFDANGRCINLIGTVHDVTERKRLEEVRARLAAVVESSDDAIISKTLEGIITTWNQGAERMFGYTAAEAVGKPVTILIPPDRNREELEILARLQAGKRIDHYETLRVRKDGTLLDVSLTVSPIRDGSGVIIGASKIARDITAQKKTEEGLRKSEERYRLLGEIVPHLLWMTDAEGRPNYFNERWHAYTGQTESEALQSPAGSVLHPDDRAHTAEIWKNSVTSGEPFECEYRIRRHDGEYRWFVARGMPLRDEAGRIVRWYGSSTDIHQHKVTAEALREEYIVTEQLNGVAKALATELDLTKIVQIITDAGTRITRAQFGAFFYNRVNEEGESYMLYTLSGVSREAFEKFPMPRATGLFGPTFRGEGVIRIDDVRQDSRFGKNPPYHGMPEGHLPVVSYLAVSVFARSGDVIGGLFFGHPKPGVFTERDEKIIVGIAAQAAAAMDNARVYQAEQQARAAAERANKAKDDFLATLSHELRNPLNPVLLIASEAAQNPELSAEVRGDFEMIQRNVELEARLIDDLLDLTRITRRKMSLELRPVEVHEVLHEAIAIVRRDAETKNLAITSIFAAENTRIMADPARLQQIFWNVLRNAVKFTPENGKISIVTRNVPKKHELEIEVTDTGIGMTAEEITRIFEAFSQGDHAGSTGAHRFGGLGLGLAIAQYLVRMHGGRIEAKSGGLNQGSTFFVVLPLLERSEPAAKTGKAPAAA